MLNQSQAENADQDQRKENTDQPQAAGMGRKKVTESLDDRLSAGGWPVLHEPVPTGSSDLVARITFSSASSAS